jgi:phenylacetate-CoA ligase
MEKVIEVFQKTAAVVPAYKKILAQKGILPENVKTIEDFEKTVPVLYKADMFTEFSPEELCFPGAIDSLASAIVTSGTSGSFAYKVITKQELEDGEKMIDSALEVFLQASKLKTCVINVLAMGVGYTSSYPVISTSVRSDIAWQVVRNFAPNFDQIIVNGDPNFVKKFIEEGRKNNFGNAAGKLKLVTGGDWSSQSYSEYMQNALGDKNENNIFSNFGVTEIGLSVGAADTSLFKIRKTIQENKNIQMAIFGTELKTAPALFFYDPERTYIEKINKNLLFSELAFSTLSNSSMPFIRYATDDYGTILDPQNIKTILENNGIKDLAPALPLPILALAGRVSNQVTNKKITVSAEDVKQIFYSNSEIAKNITGNFRLSPAKSSSLIEVQLMDGVKPSDLQKLIKKSMVTLEKSIVIKVYEYHKFPYNMVLDYESKWAYTQVNKK